MVEIPSNAVRVGPQPGPQTAFLSTPADIAIYGGAAGGGKTYGLLLESLRNTPVKGFGAVIFRRTMKQVKQEGGIWDASTELFPAIGAKPNQTESYWSFPSGSTVQFAGLEHDKSKYDYQGAEICLIGFDELLHFLKSQFWYMLSRNRSTCGVRPYVRGTINPGPGWVRDELLAPWVNPQFPDRAASGELRWFIRENDQMVWVPKGTPFAKSLTFIRASLHDNQALMLKDPDYESNLNALNEVDRKALRDGDWYVNLPNRVLSGYDSTRHKVPWHVPPEGAIRTVAVDFGLINGAELAIYEDPDDKALYVFGENWPGHRRPTDRRADDIRRICRGTPHKGYGGNRTTEQDSRELLAKHGIPCAEPLAKDPGTQYQCVNDEFDDNKLFIMDNCTKLIAMIESFQNKRGPDDEVLDEFDDGPYHLCAALRYGVSSLRPPRKRKSLKW